MFASCELVMLNVALVMNSKLVPPKTNMLTFDGKQISIDEVDRQKPLTAKTDPMPCCGGRNEARIKFVRLQTQQSASGYFSL